MIHLERERDVSQLKKKILYRYKIIFHEGEIPTLFEFLETRIFEKNSLAKGAQL